MDEADFKKIVDGVEQRCATYDRACSVEEIQDMVEEALMASGYHWVARAYVRYRYDREKLRTKNTTDDSILALIDRTNEEIKQENSNKNPTVNSTLRDYMAGEVSKDLTRRVLLPQDIVDAHEQGIIHFHDSDYFAQHMHNCDLVNLEDMLQNGTVISDTLIEKPKTFSTACNIATQIIAQVASNQYGGQTITLSHLAPFVDETRKKYQEKFKDMGDEFIEKLVHDDVEKGIQTIQYQILTLLTSNGQTPFITVYMDINEVEDSKVRKDLALIIEEVLKQRIQGVKNEVGVWVTPTFPKLIYALDENNVYPDSEYYYLTELAAKCTAKRMVPDYISAKVMRELKKGDVYTCMGCRSFLTPDRFTDNGVGNIANAKNYIPGKHKYYGRLTD
jgi:ribonucleoside-triphosphate reductase